MKPDVSIIIPAYNEERIIRSSLRKLADYIAAHRQELGLCEVIVVAAGTDKTAVISREFEQDFSSLQVITPSKRAGKGRDVRVGAQAARGAVQLFMDADLSTPLAHIPKMINELRAAKADVVIGVRQLTRIHSGALRSLLSVASNLLIRLLLFPRLRDTQCGFKGFTSSAAKILFASQKVIGWGFDLELLQYAKEVHFKVIQMPIKDWRETRKDKEDFRGQFFGSAAITTLRDLAVVRTGAWLRSLVRHWPWCVALGMIASFSTSLYIGLQQSVWFDEAYSITLAQQSFSKLINLTAVDAHPPFYYVTLKVWTSFFGTNELALRSLSAVCLALAVGAAAWLVKRMFGTAAALTALLFVVCAPFLLRYGFEIRMYAMATLIGLLATHTLLTAVKPTGRKQWVWWILYAMLVALGMLTLYYTAFIWIVHLTWLVYRWRQERPRTPLLKQPWLGAFAGSVILFSPWLSTFYDQFTHSALSGVSQAITYRELVGIVSMMFSFLTDWQLDPWESLSIVAVIFISCAYVVKAWRLSNPHKRQYLVLLLTYSLLPIGLLLVGSLPPLHPLFLDRYVSHIVIAGYLLVGVSLAIAYRAKPAKRIVLAGAFLLALSIAGVWNLSKVGNFTFERLMRPQAKQVAIAIGGCQDVTVVTGDPLLYFEMHYYLPQCDMLFFNNDQIIGERGGYAILHNSGKEIFTNGPFNAAASLYYVYTSEQPPYKLPDTYKKVGSDNKFEKFHLVRYQQ